MDVNMNRTNRLAKIRKIVEQRGRVEVKELSKIFGVSEVMIRRDLTILEQRECLKRAYGVAMPVKNETDFGENRTAACGIDIGYDQNKEEIGRIAAGIVDNSGWIFIGEGITCYYVAKELAKMEKINVLTNNLLAAIALSQNKQSNVIFTGGKLVHDYLYVAGEMFARYLDGLHITQAFMGVGGVDFSAGYTVNEPTELVVYQSIKEIADELIIVLDSGKFDKKTFLGLGKLDLSDKVITNTDVPAKYVECYKQLGVEVLNTYVERE